MSIHQIFFALGLASSIAGCATRESGVRDPVRFREIAEITEISSLIPPDKLAACFEDTAALLPMSVFRTDPATGVVSYRLRGFGYTFEEIDFFPGADPVGTQITVRLAPGVNAKWRRDFERDRMAPLQACAAG